MFHGAPQKKAGEQRIVRGLTREHAVDGLAPLRPADNAQRGERNRRALNAHVKARHRLRGRHTEVRRIEMAGDQRTARHLVPALRAGRFMHVNAGEGDSGVFQRRPAWDPW